MDITEHVRLQTEQPDLDAADMAHLELIGKAAQTEHAARQAYLRLAGDYGEDMALKDHDARAIRYKASFDGKYRRVAWTHADSTNGATLQHWWSWERLTAKHNGFFPDHKLSERQFRALSYELRDLGVLEIKNRTREDATPPTAPLPLNPTAQTSSLFTVHVGLVAARRVIVHHDWNAPLTVAADAPVVTCQECQKAYEPKRSDQTYCSSACKQKAYRARVTDNSSGSSSGCSSGTAPNSPLTSPGTSPSSSAGDDDGRPSASVLEEEDLQLLEAEAWLESMGMVFPVLISAGKKLGIDDLVPLLLDLNHHRIRGWQGDIKPGMIIAHLDSIYETWKQQVAEEKAQARLDAQEAEETRQRLDAEHAERERKVAELVELSMEYARLRGSDPDAAAERARDMASANPRTLIEGHLADAASKRIADERDRQHKDKHPGHYRPCGACLNCYNKRPCNESLWVHRDDIDCDFVARA